MGFFQGIAIFLPQQLPGPGQPACSGFAPQQPPTSVDVILPLLTPERDEGTDSSFFKSLLPHAGHFGSIFEPDTRTSILSWQVLHEYSKIGIEYLH